MSDRLPHFSTERLELRSWDHSDREPFAKLNADPEVMELFPAPLSRKESDDLVDRIEAEWSRRGFGLWALEVRSTGQFIGFTGLAAPTFDAAFTPAVEVGWRLSRDAWGRGYATEAANVALTFAFQDIRLSEVVSFTSEANQRSRAVMRRLGMTHDPTDDFDHPALPVGHPLRRHVLYRMPISCWRVRAAERSH